MRLALHADRGGTVRFAPLEGETFRRLVSPGERSRLPDSLVLREAGGALLTRSEAVVALLRRFGRPWSWLAGAGGLLPRSLADHLYDGLARRRRRWFRSPPASCPRVSPGLLARFDP